MNLRGTTVSVRRNL